MRTGLSLFVVTAFLALAQPVWAQEPAPQQPAAPQEEQQEEEEVPEEPVPVESAMWTGSFGAGLAMTRGNSDTSNINVSFDTTYDPEIGFVFKAEGLFLRGESEGDETANRLFAQGRVEHPMGRLFLFGQVQYLRDTFKEIDYMMAPTAGAGYKLIDTPNTKFSIDVSGGFVFEALTDQDLESTGALVAGEKFSQRISDTASLIQSAQGLWKLDDFGDSLYTASVGIAAQVTKRAQLKAELLETYKSQPPDGVDSGDMAVLVSFVFKF